MNELPIQEYSIQLVGMSVRGIILGDTPGSVVTWHFADAAKRAAIRKIQCQRTPCEKRN